MIDTTRIRQWTYQDFKIFGTSWAGLGTCVVWPEMGIVFDVAQGLPVAVNQGVFLITHGHMDHAGGIPYLISQKALAHHAGPQFYMPQELTGPMRTIVDTWEQIEGHKYNFSFQGVEPGRDYQIKGAHFFRAFQTPHRVPSLGYTIFGRHKQLKPECVGLRREQLIAMRQAGQEIESEISEPLLTFTGDTRIEFLNGPDWVRQAKVLITEVTYIDSAKSVESAREWGHIHLDELLAKLHLIQSERLLLIHLSSRYRLNDFKEILKRRLPDEWQGRVDVLGGD